MSTSAKGPADDSSTSASTINFPTRPYTPHHKIWPYTPSDFLRQDETLDTRFYSAPRFVTHIDDPAIASLKTYYAATLPRRGRILDFCSSWISHYPPTLEDAVRKGELEVVGMGMSGAELEANKILGSGGRVVQDLNTFPRIPESVGEIDAATCVVSIDYLTKPVEVLESLRERTKEGGSVHLVVSNRCFPTKVVGRWLRISEEERLEMVGDYLWFAGWRGIEIVTVSDGKLEGDEPKGLMAWLRGGRDPLWVVRGSKVGD
ncbi:hypothetical protein W97_00261 [Coniosporium apollinis CBS 100218]|uniref:Methyltransferase type 11 domain-containing protein n=1 Tax=Coniosporium apollinis (strain CBS 100218) TaxID=1168221 RepID=R7YGN2_CONA1|nr:uncharacterized protein W97_00261 [Coniosporium apollinis CBS 100218]EON61050.1 hypothetical protein W97_00261 [Coniosporium apollinis CBS 100218]